MHFPWCRKHLKPTVGCCTKQSAAPKGPGNQSLRTWCWLLPSLALGSVLWLSHMMLMEGWLQLWEEQGKLCLVWLHVLGWILLAGSLCSSWGLLPQHPLPLNMDLEMGWQQLPPQLPEAH